jgi:hypothetical protein
MSDNIIQILKWPLAIGFGLSEAAQIREFYLYLQSVMPLTRLHIIFLIGLACCVTLLSAKILADNIEKRFNISYTFPYHKNKRFWKFMMVVVSICCAISGVIPFLVEGDFLGIPGGESIVAASLAGAIYTVIHAMFVSEMPTQINVQTQNSEPQSHAKKTHEKYSLRIDVIAMINIFLVNVWLLCCTIGVALFPVGITAINLWVIAKLILALAVLAVSTAYRYFFSRRVAMECYLDHFDKIIANRTLCSINFIISAGVACFSYYVCVVHPLCSLGVLTQPVALFVGVINFIMGWLCFGCFLVKSMEAPNHNAQGIDKVNPQKQANMLNERLCLTTVVFAMAIVLAAKRNTPIMLVILPLFLLSFMGEEGYNPNILLTSAVNRNAVLPGPKSEQSELAVVPFRAPGDDEGCNEGMDCDDAVVWEQVAVTCA